MKREIRYIAIDGEAFQTEEECLAYEKDLQQQMDLITKWLNLPEYETVYDFYNTELNYQNSALKDIKRLRLKDQHGNLYLWVPKDERYVEVYIFEGITKEGEPTLDLFDEIQLDDFFDYIRS